MDDEFDSISDEELRSQYENLVIAEPRYDSDEDQSTLIESLGQEVTEISIHTAGTGTLQQNIASPINLKFVDLDSDTSEEIKPEEEAFDASETAGYDDGELLLDDSEEDLINQLKINNLVEVSLNVTLLKGVLSHFYSIVGATVEIPARRIKPLRNDRLLEKTFEVRQLRTSDIELKLSRLAALRFTEEGELKISLNFRPAWNSWDLIWQNLASCGGFQLQQYLEVEDKLHMVVDNDSSMY